MPFSEGDPCPLGRGSGPYLSRDSLWTYCGREAEILAVWWPHGGPAPDFVGLSPMVCSLFTFWNVTSWHAEKRRRGLRVARGQGCQPAAEPGC